MFSKHEERAVSINIMLKSNKMAQLVKHLSGKEGDLSLNPGPTRKVGDRQLYKLFSDLHMHALWHVHAYIHIIYTANNKIK